MQIPAATAHIFEQAPDNQPGADDTSGADDPEERQECECDHVNCDHSGNRNHAYTYEGGAP